jgi:hypothetical protein
MKGRVLAAAGAVAIGLALLLLTESALVSASELSRATAVARSHSVATQATAHATPAPPRAAAKPAAQRIALKISTRTLRPVAGARVTFTVRLTANGKPVAKSRVGLKLQSRPGTDARLVPASGMTDSRGVFRGVLRLSRKAGTYLLVVRSDRHLARLRLVSTPFRRAGQLASNPILAWVALATIGLVLLGIFVNLEVLRRVTWSLTLGRLRRRRAGGSAGGLPRRP